MRSDNVLSYHTVILQHASEMLQCTPPTGHVTFHFHFLRIKKNVYTVIMKQSDIFVVVKCEMTGFKRKKKF